MMWTGKGVATMAKRSKTEIYSIFGQIDGVVAETMVKEGKASKIEADMIPPSAMFDDAGRKAMFAIVLPTNLLGEFNRRARELRA